MKAAFEVLSRRCPSPQPSPRGEGAVASNFLTNSSATLLERGKRFSLSLRERAGVRGNGALVLTVAAMITISNGCKPSAPSSGNGPQTVIA